MSNDRKCSEHGSGGANKEGVVAEGVEEGELVKWEMGQSLDNVDNDAHQRQLPEQGDGFQISKKLNKAIKRLH